MMYKAIVAILVVLVSNTLAQQGFNNPCNSTLPCINSQFLECVSQFRPDHPGTCRCRSGSIWKGSACQTEAGQTCSETSLLRCVAEATCVAGRCLCRAGFDPKPIKQEMVCVGRHRITCGNTTTGPTSACDSSLGLVCRRTSDPDETFLRCDCPSTKIYSNVRGKCVALSNNACNIQDDCVDNADCRVGSCTCAADHHFSANLKGECVLNQGADCRNAACNDDQGLACSGNNTCQCTAPKVYEDIKCKSILGGTCVGNDDCTGNSTCHSASGTCICDLSTGVVKVSDRSCENITRTLGSHCETNDHCDVQHYLTCSTAGRCVCQTGMTLNGVICVHSAGTACTPNRGCVQNSECINSICECYSGTSKTSDDQCQKTINGTQCMSSPCNSEEGLICRTNTCTCPAGQVWSDEVSHCVALVSGDCSVTKSLCTANATCSTLGVCECDEGYSAHSALHSGHPNLYRTCQRTHDQSCNSTTDPCNDQQFLVCHATHNNCTCELPLEQVWDDMADSCVSIVGGFCGRFQGGTDEIGFEREMKCLGSATCSNKTNVVSTCKCDIGFSSNEAGQCQRSGANANRIGVTSILFVILVSMFK